MEALAVLALVGGVSYGLYRAVVALGLRALGDEPEMTPWEREFADAVARREREVAEHARRLRRMR